MNFFSTLYVRYADYDFVYHIFYTDINSKVEIEIRETEHKEAKWISPKKALKLPLMEDEEDCIQLFFGIEPSK